MRDLADLDCRPWQGGEPPLSAIEIRELNALLPAWEWVEEAGAQYLRRQFIFDRQTIAMDFVQQITSMAGEESHYPAMVCDAHQVTITWGTQAIQGLHRNDFILAARTEKLYSSFVF